MSTETEDQSAATDEAAALEAAFEAAISDREKDAVATAEPSETPERAEEDPATEQQPAAAADKAAAPEPKPVDWTQAPPELRAAFEKTLETERRRLGGQVSTLQRQLNELSRISSAPVQQPPRDPAKPQTPQEADDLASLREEYPEIVGPVLDRMAELQRRVDGILATENGRQQAVMVAREQELLTTHPDFYDVLSQRGAEFNAWVESEAPVRYARIVAANRDGIRDPIAAAEVFEAFKRHVGLVAPAPSPDPVADRRARQLRAAAVPSTRGTATAAQGLPSDADVEAHFNAIVERRAKGR